MHCFLLQLQLANLVIQLVQFDLLTFNLLIVIRKLFVSLLLLAFHLCKLSLRIEQVVLGLAEVLLSHPALPLFVSLLVYEVLKLGPLMAQLLLHLTVSTADPVNLLLQHLAFVRFVLNATFHLINL